MVGELHVRRIVSTAEGESLRVIEHSGASGRPSLRGIHRQEAKLADPAIPLGDRKKLDTLASSGATLSSSAARLVWLPGTTARAVPARRVRGLERFATRRATKRDQWPAPWCEVRFHSAFGRAVEALASGHWSGAQRTERAEPASGSLSASSRAESPAPASFPSWWWQGFEAELAHGGGWHQPESSRKLGGEETRSPP